LRDDYDTALKKGGIAIPAGMTGPKLVASTCTTRTPECQKALAAFTANAAGLKLTNEISVPRFGNSSV
jgi:hypothetical protein